ncbi:hypothetical protein DL89DRAFT_181415 [Linderina pennispora]|uniref:Uncharacterized protein n=1 Tax=Linderina pennispora TaxID=61395 RepID=A0A1Y1W559_9FUNG|nr:uncharacterized protein DL89DRAFT_181415 [Linderina pennispora]ORX68657.1 hypothetical protein DL89DRAFT_181415 [Linderina pennispora]
MGIHLVYSLTTRTWFASDWHEAAWSMSGAADCRLVLGGSCFYESPRIPERGHAGAARWEKSAVGGALFPRQQRCLAGMLQLPRPMAAAAGRDLLGRRRRAGIDGNRLACRMHVVLHFVFFIFRTRSMLVLRRRCHPKDGADMVGSREMKKQYVQDMHRLGVSRKEKGKM